MRRLKLGNPGAESDRSVAASIFQCDVNSVTPQSASFMPRHWGAATSTEVGPVLVHQTDLEMSLNYDLTSSDHERVQARLVRLGFFEQVARSAHQRLHADSLRVAKSRGVR